MLGKLMLAASVMAAMTAGVAQAATFAVVDTDTVAAFGTFDADPAGGFIGAGNFLIKGGYYDQIGTGGLAPIFQAFGTEISGKFGLGGFFNGTAFDTTDIDGNPFTCAVADCVLVFTPGNADTESGWSVAAFDNGNGRVIATGSYDVIPASVPLPASAPLLLLAAGGLVALRRKR